MNLFGGAGHVLRGEVATEDPAALGAETVQASGDDASSFWVAFGFFLWLMFVLQVLCAIMLFISQGRPFVLVVCSLSVLTELACMWHMGFIVWQVFGLVGGVLGLAGVSMRNKPGVQGVGADNGS